MRSDKFITVKVNHVCRIICNPYLRFPCYVTDIVRKYLFIRNKGTDKKGKFYKVYYDEEK